MGCTWAAGTGCKYITVSVDRAARPPCCSQLSSLRPALWSAGECLPGRAEPAGAQAAVISVDVLLRDGKGSNSRLSARLPLLRSVLGCPLQLPHSEVSRVPPTCGGEGDRQATVPPPDLWTVKLFSQGVPCGCCQVSLGQVLGSGQTSVSLRGWLSSPPHPSPFR